MAVTCIEVVIILNIKREIKMITILVAYRIKLDANVMVLKSVHIDVYMLQLV